MADMRRLAHLFKYFKQQCEKAQKLATSSADLLVRSNFEETKEAIQMYTNSDQGVKAGLKTQLYYLIKRFAKIIKGTHLDNDRAAEIDNFVQVLELHKSLVTPLIVIKFLLPIHITTTGIASRRGSVEEMHGQSYVGNVSR